VGYINVSHKCTVGNLKSEVGFPLSKADLESKGYRVYLPWLKCKRKTECEVTSQ
jgi:hypothetical protein